MAEKNSTDEFRQFYSHAQGSVNHSEEATVDSRFQDLASHNETIETSSQGVQLGGVYDPQRLVRPASFNDKTWQGYRKLSNESALVAGEDPQDPKYKYGLRIFLLVSVVSAFVVLALEAFMFGVITKHRYEFYEDRKFAEMSIYLALFIFAAIYQVAITFIGLYSNNMLLLSMLCFFYAVMLVYTGIQYLEMSDGFYIADSKTWMRASHATNIATICVLAATLVIQVLLIYFQLWNGVRWYRFKKIGASFEIKRLYSFFQVHRSLLIFDFFFFLGFTVQFLVIMVKDKRSVEFILTCCMLPLTILVLYASDLAATKEWLLLTIATICCFIGGCVYVLFKIIRLYTKYTSAYRLAVAPGGYFPGRSSLVAFGVITLVFLFSTLVMEGFMIYGYNKGLLPLVDPKHRSPQKHSETDMFQDLDLID